MSSYSTIMKELERDLKMKGRDLRKFQKGIEKNHQARMKCDTQLAESEFVLKELNLLKEDTNVYKLVGPILVKQDPAEPNVNVRKKIDYLSAELDRIDSTIQDLKERQNSKMDSISKVEQRLRSMEFGNERTMSIF